MSVSIVQSASTVVNTAGPVSVTLANPPAPGNLLLLAFSCSQIPSAISGWTTIVNTGTSTPLYYAYRVVQSGDPSTYSFSSKYGTVIVVELTYVGSSSPTLGTVKTGSNATTPSVTVPSSGGMLIALQAYGGTGPSWSETPPSGQSVTVLEASTTGDGGKNLYLSYTTTDPYSASQPYTTTISGGSSTTLQGVLIWIPAGTTTNALRTATSTVSGKPTAKPNALLAAISAVTAKIAGKQFYSSAASSALSSHILYIQKRTHVQSSTVTGKVTPFPQALVIASSITTASNALRAAIRVAATSASAAAAARTAVLIARATAIGTASRGVAARVSSSGSSVASGILSVASKGTFTGTSIASPARAVVGLLRARGTTAISAAKRVLALAATFAASAASAKVLGVNARGTFVGTTAAVGSRGFTHFLVAAVSVVASAARGARANAVIRGTTALVPLPRGVASFLAHASSAVSPQRRVIAVVSARVSSLTTGARAVAAILRASVSSTTSARAGESVFATRSASVTTSGRVAHVIGVLKSASTLARAAIHAIVSGRIASATASVTARSAPIATMTRSATIATGTRAARLIATTRSRATSAVTARALVVRAIVRVAVSAISGTRSMLVEAFARGMVAVRGLFVNSSDTLGQDEVCYDIEDALIRLFTAATQPGGALAAVSQYAPVAVIEHVVPPEQRIFPVVAVQFRRLDSVATGIDREDVTAYYDIAVAVEQPYVAGSPATIANARASLSAFVDDGAGNGIIELLRADPTLGGICRRSKVVALEEATLRKPSSTASARVAAFIVLQCDYMVTVA